MAENTRSSQAQNIWARMEQNTRTVERMPTWVKGSPVNTRETPPTPCPTAAPNPDSDGTLWI